MALIKRTKKELNALIEEKKVVPITYECPIRGPVTQYVEVKKFKSNYNPSNGLGVRSNDELFQAECEYDDFTEEFEDEDITIN